MTGDCYAILGVHPAAEDVVIGAAYRALMRHYHPDTNSDPQAQARAREITAAYALLRDPAKRAEYDAARAEGGLWLEDEPPLPRPPPAMRTAGIAAALLALGLVGAVWVWPQPDRPQRPPDMAAQVKPPAPKPAPAPTVPVVQLEPESERLAALHRLAPPKLTPPLLQELQPIEPLPSPPPQPLRTARARPLRAPVVAPSAPAIAIAPQLASAKPVVEKSKTVTPAKRAPRNDRLATLDRMAAGFFSQSMVHANPARQEALLGARNRSAALRKACNSDSCLTDAYLRQMREISAIMEGRSAPAK